MGWLGFSAGWTGLNRLFTDSGHEWVDGSPFDVSCVFFFVLLLIAPFSQYKVTIVIMINHLVVCQLGGGGTKQRNGSRKLCFCCWIFWVSINDQDQYSPFICNHCIARNARRIFYNARFIEKWYMDLTNQRFQYALV